MLNRAELAASFQAHLLTGVGVEVGVEYGGFSLEILKTWTGELWCVDKWEDESIYQEARANLGDRCIRKTSVEASEQFGPESLDFVYLDAAHDYQSVKADLEAWYPKMRKGGVFAGHDYCRYLDFGVIEAVDEFAKTHGLTVQLTESDEWEGVNFQSWYLTKV